MLAHKKGRSPRSSDLAERPNSRRTLTLLVLTAEAARAVQL